MASSIDVSDLFGVKGLIAVVTGGGTGIGLMIAQALEANGAIVYIIGRRKEVLDKAAATAKHGNIRALQGDVTSKPDLERAVSAIESAHGYVNVVVANSGIGGPGIAALPPQAGISEFRSALWATDAAAFTRTYDVNVTAVFYTAVAFLGLLDAGNARRGPTAAAPRSQIIATASIGAYNRVPLAGYAYGGSKAAVIHMMKQFSTAFVPYGIRANVIAPGFYPSDLTETLIKAQEAKGEEGWPKSMVPEQRAGEPQDMAGAVLFLVSRAGAYINGNVLVTDGGRLGVLPSAY